MHFQVLVMGRANAGKTTILQRVCNSMDEPEIFNGEGNKVSFYRHGYHEIEHELMFKSNPGFVFRDSCGFKVGSIEQFEQMRKFVMDRTTTKRVNEHVHTIWYGMLCE
ncbi:hypothetical protein EDD16DRAFT_1472448 [Pisolithus croceorrhizus]|nr:hypothetical protein EDD16DRAFT_1472448 [Pisolithus croceorrhizus]KAI6128566.1 hypothetical protein EV401DRAFT_1853625 [Pisolithus croceorrhizus]KAI6156452.1 hypothetical protein EDD17DRAFT_1489058 [Pisolithus thermaeus]